MNENLFILILILLVVIKLTRKSKKECYVNDTSICAYDSSRVCRPDSKCVATESDVQNALEYANKTMCEKGGYIYTSYPDGTNDCTHTKETCLRDSADPTKNVYLEWRPASNKCVMAMGEFKKYCNDANLQYDQNTGKCNVTSESCKAFGADLKNQDCVVPVGQKIGEGILGTTAVRSIKKGFKC